MNEFIAGLADGIIIGTALVFLYDARKDIWEWIGYQIKKYTYIIKHGSPFNRNKS